MVIADVRRFRGNILESTLGKPCKLDAARWGRLPQAEAAIDRFLPSAYAVWNDGLLFGFFEFLVVQANLLIKLLADERLLFIRCVEFPVQNLIASLQLFG